MCRVCYPSWVRRAREVAPTSPEQHLQKAVCARSAATRAKYAQLGLAGRAPLDPTTQAMLLRQLYLAHFEGRRFEQSLEVATQMIALDVLPDVAHQDAARSCQALGDVDRAVGHLRLAARSGPASRRAFHQWTLGGLYYLAGRHAEAVDVLARASRWGTTDRPLYVGHLLLARSAGAGAPARGIPDAIARLESAPCGRGYGRFVLGRLCAWAGRREEAEAHLEAFVERTTSGRVALAIALAGEVDEARCTLARLRGN